MGGLAKGVGNSAKIQEAKFPKELRDRRNVGGFCVEVPCNEDGASGCTCISAMMSEMMALVLAAWKASLAPLVNP